MILWLNKKQGIATPFPRGEGWGEAAEIFITDMYNRIDNLKEK
jgi:hypothetical protein